MTEVTRFNVDAELASFAPNRVLIATYIDQLEQRVKAFEELLSPTLALVKDMRLTDLMIASSDLGYDYTKLAEHIEAAIAPQTNTERKNVQP